MIRRPIPGVGHSAHGASPAGVLVAALLFAMPAFAQLDVKLERTEHGGMRVASLRDEASGQQLLADENEPLFWINLHEAETGAGRSISARGGWRSVALDTRDSVTTIRWSDPVNPDYEGIAVDATMTRREDGSVAWTLRATIANPKLKIYNVIFPQIAIREQGDDHTLLVPDGCGVAHRDIWHSPVTYERVYPSMRATMQFFALYDATRTGGFYLGLHDPTAAMKRLSAVTQLDRRRVLLSVIHEPPGKGTAVRHVDVPGEVVWAPLAGDWFDAAVRYRAWVRDEATWYPKLTEGRRADTPAIIRNGVFWLSDAGDPAKGFHVTKPILGAFDVPVGVHFYSWHEIPFDNDYPHFLPPRNGFDASVAALNERGVLTMPYTNGRLWDTRDRGAFDASFTTKAKAAAAKHANGKPIIETYGSKEADGSDVRFAVMCPATELWQQTVADFAGDLVRKHGVRGVYLDQVAAAAPALCMDEAHGHPVGGGGWWVESYSKMLERVRERIGDDAVLTTESTAEPYLKHFDGLLSWDWQADGQVPAFPAVYGGAIQLFGRNYTYWKDRPTAELALRQKAGQAFTFGEQIGWVYPQSVLGLEDGARFFKHLARLRWHLRDYFAAGEMARPPVIEAQQPRLKADWYWHNNERWVTTDAVMVAAWSMRSEKRTVLLAVNVGDKAVVSRLSLGPEDYGLDPRKFTVTQVADDGTRKSLGNGNLWLHKPVRFEPRQATVFELHSR